MDSFHSSLKERYIDVGLREIEVKVKNLENKRKQVKIRVVRLVVTE